MTRLLPEVLARFMRTAPFQDPAVARRARTLLGAEERAAFPRLRSLTARRDYLAAHGVKGKRGQRAVQVDDPQIHANAPA